MLPDRFRAAWAPAGFLALALLTGWLLAGLLPLGQAADEGAHAVRIDALSHGRVLGHRDGMDGGITAPPTLLDVAMATMPRNVQTLAGRNKAEGVPWGAPARFVELGTIATYFPAVYAPAAAAVKLTRWLGATPAQSFLAGRQCNVLAFGLLGTAALGLARRGRAVITAALLLPMSLGLAASLSGDGLLIAFAALAAACLTRGDERGWWGAAGLLTLVGLTKLPYAPLLLVLLAPARPAAQMRWGVVAVSAALMLGWTAFNQATVMGVFSRPPYEAGPLWPGPPRRFDAIDPAAQLQVLGADPLQAVTLAVRTLTERPSLGKDLVGVLGWLSIPLPGVLYAAWAAVLAAVGLALLIEPGPARLGQRVSPVGLLAVALSAWAIMLAQYLGWTLVGAAVIDGVQGRYFLPLLPFLCVSVPCLRAAWPPRLAAGLLLLPLTAGALGLVVVPVTVALASFLH